MRLHRDMPLILQPPGSKICGQACVAMVADIPLEQSIEMFGHQDGTRTRELIRVLRELGWKTADRLAVAPKKDRDRWGCMALGIRKVRFRATCQGCGCFVGGGIHCPQCPQEPKGLYYSKTTHWVVNNYGQIYDPSSRIFSCQSEYERSWYAEIISGLRVWRPNDKT